MAASEPAPIRLCRHVSVILRNSVTASRRSRKLGKFRRNPAKIGPLVVHAALCGAT
jgi:hypothetical protein